MNSLEQLIVFFQSLHTPEEHSVLALEARSSQGFFAFVTDNGYSSSIAITVARLAGLKLL